MIYDLLINHFENANHNYLILILPYIIFTRLLKPLLSRFILSTGRTSPAAESAGINTFLSE